jgi:nucleoside-diphosphate-sugar epimerase
MRVLVTGADGFLGRYLAADLPGHTVICASRRPMAGVDWRPLPDLGGDVDWAPLLQGVDAVVHLANIAHQQASEDDFARVNQRATASLCAAAMAAGVRQFVYLSSIYAQVGHSSARVIRETDTPAPINAYGRSKLATERAVAESGVPYTVLRPALVLGAGAKGNAGTLEKLARLPLPLPLGSIDAKRSFLSVENFPGAVATVLADPRALGETYIVADPEPRTVGEVVADMRTRLGRNPNLFSLPRGSLELGLKAIGGQGIWEKIGMPFIASADKLLTLGWKPKR